jgi:DNA repair protein RadC
LPQRATPFSPSRPARGCAVLASALRAALTAALRRGADLPAGNPACKTKESSMPTRKRSARGLNVRLDSGAIVVSAPRFSSGFVAEVSGASTLVSDDDVISAALGILAARVARSQALTSPADTRDYLAVRFADLEHEVFTCLFLDARHHVLACEELFRGTVDGSSVHAREVVKRALVHNAAAVILAHNHPSGIAEPSEADRSITLKLAKALALVEVRLLDHLIVGGATVVSMAERGLV